jgi:hypothetical protein
VIGNQEYGKRDSIVKKKIILFLEILKYYISQFGIDFQEFIPKIGFPPFKSP